MYMELAPIFNLNLKPFEFEKMYQNQNLLKFEKLIPNLHLENLRKYLK
jgi:hypothetical protein